MLNRFTQYELWHDCNQNCKFCHYLEDKAVTDSEFKLARIATVRKLMSDDIDSGIYDEVGFIGGEFFAGQLANQRVHQAFYGLLSDVAEMIAAGKVNKLYVASALMHSDNHYIDEFCYFLFSKQIQAKTLLCTSYDTVGRFDDMADELRWKANVKHVHDKCPGLKVHVEMILTGDLLKKINAGEFSLPSFTSANDVTVDFIAPHAFAFSENSPIWNMTCAEYNARILHDFFPSRNDFLHFMTSGVLSRDELQKLASMRIRSDRNQLLIRGKPQLLIDRRQSDSSFNAMLEKCNVKYITGYADSDSTLEDDAEIMRLVNS